MSVIRFKAPKTCQVVANGPLVQYADYLKLEKELQSLKPVWLSPATIPAVEKGTEKQYWIATYNKRRDSISVYLAIYQNRPLEVDDNGEYIDDDYLVNADGEPHESIGWVENKSHYEFDDFYMVIDFNDNYQLLGWAEYQPPAFNLPEKGGAA